MSSCLDGGGAMPVSGKRSILLEDAALPRSGSGSLVYLRRVVVVVGGGMVGCVLFVL